MSTFINFKELRAQLDFRAVLLSYGVPATNASASKYQGHCPLPTHAGESRKSSFSADFAKGIWQCFGCKASGNLLDFAVRMELLDPTSGADVRKVALKLHRKHLDHGGAQSGAGAHESTRTEEGGAVRVNAPLDFELKGLDPDHPSVQALGLKQETVAHFGLGYCSRGSLKGRIAVPLHDATGTLVGYAGRWSNVTSDTPDEPLYLLPGDRERSGITYRFDPGELLYAASTVADRPVPKLIVAEELSLVWHLHEFGVPAVALVTPHLSSSHEALLSRLVVRGGAVFVGRSSR